MKNTQLPKKKCERRRKGASACPCIDARENVRLIDPYEIQR